MACAPSRYGAPVSSGSTRLLRDGLLEGRAVGLAGTGHSRAIEAALSGLGARLQKLDPGAWEDGSMGEDALLAQRPLDALVHDAAADFGEGGADGLRAALERTWLAVRAVATASLIPAGRGKIVLVGPRSDAAPFSAAARDGLENTARTLSVEWARYAITTTMIAPGQATTDEEVATLVCFLISPAGDYFSGCRFELGAAGG